MFQLMPLGCVGVLIAKLALALALAPVAAIATPVTIVVNSAADTDVAAVQRPTTVLIARYAQQRADSAYHLEFFANPNWGPGGHGQGKFFVGTADGVTIGSDASFAPPELAVPTHSHVITATATDADGDTSEFSDCSAQDALFGDGYDTDGSPGGRPRGKNAVLQPAFFLFFFASISQVSTTVSGFSDTDSMP